MFELDVVRIAMLIIIKTFMIFFLLNIDVNEMKKEFMYMVFPNNYAG